MSTISNDIGQRSPHTTGRILLGLLLLAPVGLCWLATLVLPAFQTISTSFQDLRLLSRQSEFVGWANYERLAEDAQFATANGFTLSLALTRVLAIAIIPLLLALAAGVFGRRVRVPVRLVFTIPLALFAPVAFAIAWRLALSPTFGAFAGSGDSQALLASPETAPAMLRLVDGLASFALACGLGLVIYGAALRGPGTTAPTWGVVARPLLITWVIVILGAIALAMQSFSLPFMLTSGGPGSSTTTLGLLQYRNTFVQFRFGVGAAVATPLLLWLGVLGLVAGLLVIIGRVQIESVPPAKPPLQIREQSQVIAALALVVLVFISLVGCSIAGWPLLWTAVNSLKSNAEIFGGEAGLFPVSPSLDAYREVAERVVPVSAPLNSVFPPLLALAIQLPLAYLGALGIGALRPLGKYSEWLLLPFFPWLFTGIGPLNIPAFQARMSAGVLDSMLGLIPPTLCSVPMLVILTLFFKGQSARQKETGAGIVNGVILPSLPLAALLAFAALLVEIQQIDWSLLVAQSEALLPMNLLLMQLSMAFSTEVPLVSAAVVSFGLPLFLPFLLIFVLFQIFYIDRLAITAAPRK